MDPGSKLVATKSGRSERKRLWFKRWRSPIVLLTTGSIICAKLALPGRSWLTVAPFGVFLGVVLLFSLGVYRKFRVSLGYLTVWAAISCLWGAVFAVCGFLQTGCSTFGCRFQAALGFSGSGALMVLAVAFATLPIRAAFGAYRWLKRRKANMTNRAAQKMRLV